MLQISMTDLNERHPEAILILGGDFNARVANAGEVPDELIEATNLLKRRTSKDQILNSRGSLFTDFMGSNGMHLLNGGTRSDHPAQYTFQSDTGGSVIDLVWSNTLGLSYIRDLRVEIDTTLSDHFKVLVELDLDLDPGEQNRATQTRSGGKTESVTWLEENKQNFVNNLFYSNRLTIDFANNDLQEIDENLRNAVLEAARDSGMARTKTQGRPAGAGRKPWYDRECREAKGLADRQLKQQVKKTHHPAEYAIFKELKKKYRNLIETKKKQYENQLTQQLSQVENINEFWQAVKRCRPFKREQPCISLQEWHEFLCSIYPVRVICNEEWLDARHPYLDAPITMAEINRSLNRAKPRKAPGPDSISNEFIKALPPNWRLYIQVMFNRILDTESTPPDWAVGALTMIHKKGDKRDPLNYRGIALMNNLAKIFTQILNYRLQEWAEDSHRLPECQAGFRAKRSCLDQIFTLTNAIHLHLRLGQRHVYGLFVDFKRAFDSVKHKELWPKLFNLGMSAKLIRTIKSLYDTAAVRVKSEGGLSEKVPVTEGVLQGEKLSPFLFILFLSDMEEYMRRRGHEGLNIDGFNDILMLLYADDLGILADTEVDLRRKLGTLKEYCDKNGLTINSSKTKIVVFRNGGVVPKHKNFYLNHNSDLIEIVNSYTYLGIPFSSSSMGLQASQEAIRKAKMASGTALAILARAKCNSWPSIAKIHDSIVKSTLLYAFPAWGLRYREEIESAQLDFYKRVLQLPKCTPSCSVRLELGILKTEYAGMEAALKYFIKIMRMDGSRYPKICLNRQLELAENTERESEFNWATQIREFLSEQGLPGLWADRRPESWEGKLGDIMSNFRRDLIDRDIESWNSLSYKIDIPRPPVLERAKYLDLRCGIAAIRSKAQVRLTNRHLARFVCNGIAYQIHPSEKCSICNLYENETVEHILERCPIYAPIRDHFLGDLRGGVNQGVLKNLLSDVLRNRKDKFVRSRDVGFEKNISEYR